MAYDPSKPANNAPVSSVELRNQLAGLKEMIDARTTAETVSDQITAEAAGPCLGFTYSLPAVSDPPTQVEVQNISDTLDNLITFLKRQ